MIVDTLPPEQRRKLTAVVEMIGRTGADGIQIRWSDDEDPLVWFVVAQFDGGVWETASGRDPVAALLRCAAQLIDGGQCRHCGQPTALDTDWENPLSAFADKVGLPICSYTYDPELATFRRSCEGEATAS
jgi:hypothetical protein